MALELIYTSVPKGLKPGSTGFCTVAMTHGMPAPMIQRLESLGGYRPVFNVGDVNASKNPPVHAHWRVNLGGHVYDVLSHVCFAGADYQGRFNKLAHHVVVTPQEQPVAGPAWVMMPEQGVMIRKWTGEPRILKPDRTRIPNGDNPLQACHAWADVAGDAGWAGMLAQSFLLDANQPAYIIYEPGTDMLALMNEAICLLPERRRWRVTFSTYFDTLPAGLECTWRCCVAGSKAAEAAPSYATSGVLIDLTSSSLGQAPENMYVRMARTGELDSQAPPEEHRQRMIIAPEPTRVPVEAAASGAAAASASADPEPIASKRPVETPAVRQQHVATAPTSGNPRKPVFWAAVILWPIVALAIGGTILWSTFGPSARPSETLRLSEKAQQELEASGGLVQTLEARIAQLERWEQKFKDAQTQLGDARRTSGELEDRIAAAQDRAAQAEQKLTGLREEIEKLKKRGTPIVSATPPEGPRKPPPDETPRSPVRPVGPAPENPVVTSGQQKFTVCKLPQWIEGRSRAGLGMGRTLQANQVLCAVRNAAAVQLVLAQPLAETLKLSEDGSKFLWSKKKSSFTDAEEIALGHAEVMDAKVVWRWEEMQATSAELALFTNLHEVVKYSTLHLQDSAGKEVGLCQFVVPAEMRVALSETEVSDTLPCSYDVCQPVWGRAVPPARWSPKKDPSTGTVLSVRSPSGVAVEFRIGRADEGQSALLRAKWASGCTPADLRREKAKADDRYDSAKQTFIDEVRKKYERFLPEMEKAEAEKRLKAYREDIGKAVSECEVLLKRVNTEIGEVQGKRKALADTYPRLLPNREKEEKGKKKDPGPVPPEKEKKRWNSLGEELQKLLSLRASLTTFLGKQRKPLAECAAAVKKATTKLNDVTSLARIEVAIVAEHSGALLGMLLLQIGGEAETP